MKTQNKILHHLIGEWTCKSKEQRISGIKYISNTRILVAGSYDSYTLANSTSLSFSKKLGTIYDASLGSSPYTCDGLTQPAIGSVTLTFNGFFLAPAVANFVL